MSRYPLIRKIYLYLFSIIGLILITVGAVRLTTLGLKFYIFTKADKFYDYPMARPVKITFPENVEKNNSIEPSKEEIDEFQKNQQSSNRQREAAEALGWIIVGLPLYFYHWKIINKEKIADNAVK